MDQSDESRVAPRALSLVRELITALTERTSGLDLSVEGDTLLDVEVDGVRCRCHRVVPRPGNHCVVLTPREQEIIRMVAKGHTNQAIADVLGISAWTVSTHVRRVFAKLNVNSRAAMVAWTMDTSSHV